MFKHKASALLLTSFLGLTTMACTSTQAATNGGVSLSQQMHTLKSNYKTFSQASTAEQALTALRNMQQAVENAKQANPESVDPSDAAQVNAYRSQLTQLGNTINQATALVQANKLSEAQALGPKMLQIRDAAHKQFR